MQSLNIFEVREGFLFEFASLSGVSKFKIYFTRPGPPISGPHQFLITRVGDRIHVAHHQPCHRMVTMLTVESAQTSVAAAAHAGAARIWR
jgi:hypothetical protein